MEEESLAGGVANAGAVTRHGRFVLRPANSYTPTIHKFLSALRDSGFEGASFPIGIEADGRERLEFIEGEVAIPPYPEWAQLDTSLTSIASLMKRFHEASREYGNTDLEWSGEMADPKGGSIICHNDVCLENIVFRNGVAVGLLDFDFAAPGRAAVDLAHFARMCVPVDDEINAAKLGWFEADRPARLRLVSDTYGLNSTDRRLLIETLDYTIARGGEFVRRRVEAGDANFIKMWNEMGGEERFDRRRQWWESKREQFVRAIT
jgi:hypothetical protein